MCLINLTRTSGASRKRRKVEKAQASQEAAGSEEEVELDKENSKPCLRPVSALLKDEALAKREIEEASGLWKKLEMEEEGTFTTDELSTLWRVAIAKSRVMDDGQLPFLCLDLVKKHVCRSNLALVRLLCVIHAARAAGRQKQVRDFIRTFIKSLVRELLEQVFSSQDQASNVMVSCTMCLDISAPPFLRCIIHILPRYSILLC